MDQNRDQNRDQDRHQDLVRVRLIFDEVIQAAPEARAELLAARCGPDTALRRRLEAMIATAEDEESFLSSPTRSRAGVPGAPGASAEAPMTERPGTRIGPYKLLQTIGEGGFGVVFMADQERPVARRVALKIIKLGMDTRQVVARFEQERQALALMDHPHIAKVLDAGATDSGRPYFVMEYVRGDPITAFADAHKLSVRARLELFAQVCQAVQHAHTKGVIHRDLKPRNVLVSMTDGRPFAKVIDFGIAKATGARLTDKTLFTEHRQLIGTPEYMSPEQAEGSPDIDTRTDVYSLGVLLYELLTGATPFDGGRLRSAAWGEMQRIIREEEPPMPSVRLSRGLETLARTAAARAVEPARLGTLVHGELDWIVMKALDKDRARRYESPSQFAADVQRHLAGEAVIAAPASAGYRLRKFVRRNKGPVMAGGAVAIALLAGIAGTTWQWFEAQRLARAAQSELASTFHATQPGADKIRGVETYSTDENGALISGFKARNLSGPDEEVNFQTTVFGPNREAIGGLAALKLLGESARGAISAVESQRAAVEKTNAELEAANARLIRQRDIARDAVYQISTISNCDVCDELGAKSVADAGMHGWLTGPLGKPYQDAPEEERQLRALTWFSTYNAARLVDETKRAALWAARGSIVAAQLALNESDAATCRVRLDACPEPSRGWEWGYLNAQLDDAAIVLAGHKTRVSSALFSPDGSRALSVGNGLWDDGTARMWDAASGKELYAVHSPGPAFISAGFMPDGRTFLTLTAPRSYIADESFPSIVQLWEAGTGAEIRRITLPEDELHPKGQGAARAALSPDGTRLIWSRSAEARTAIIDLSGNDRVTWLTSPGHFRGNAPFSPDSRLVCTLAPNAATGVETVQVWNAWTGELTFEVPPDPSSLQGSDIFTTLFSGDSRQLLINRWSGNTFVWDVTTGEKRPGPPDVGSEFGGASSKSDGVSWFPASRSPDGRLIATLVKDERGVRLWELATGREIWKSPFDLPVEAVQFSPDGTLLAVSDDSHTLRLLDTATGAAVAVLAGQTIVGRDLRGPYSAFSPDGHRLITSSDNGEVRIWELPITPAQTRIGPSSVSWTAFVPATSSVVAALPEGVLKIYDGWTGRERHTMNGAVGETYSSALSRDGRRLATMNREATTVQVWDLERAALVAAMELGKDLRADERRSDAWPMRFVGDRLLIPQLYYKDAADGATPSHTSLVEWDPATGATSTRFESFGNCYRGISVSPAEDRIVFADEDGSRTLVDARTGRTVATLDPWGAAGWAPPAAFSPDGKMLAGVVETKPDDESLQLWNATDGAPLRTVALDGSVGSIQALKFSPDGARVALATWTDDEANGGSVVLVDAASGGVVWSTTNPGKHMDNLDFAPDSQRIFTSRRMYELGVDVWDTRDGTKVLTLPFRLGSPFAMEQKDWRAFGNDAASLYVQDGAGRPVVLHARARRSR